MQTIYTNLDFSSAGFDQSMCDWPAEDLCFFSPHDTLSTQELGGLDAFEDVSFSDCSDFTTCSTDDEVICGSPVPLTPEPYGDWSHQPEHQQLQPQSQPVFHHQPTLQIQPHLQQLQYQFQLYQQYQQQQYHQLQQQLNYQYLLHPMPALPRVSYPTYDVDTKPLIDTKPLVDTKPLDGYSYEVSKSYDEPLASMKQFMPTSLVSFTNLDTSQFGGQSDPVNKVRSLPMDISGNLTDAQYYKIFKMYHLQLQLDSHPTMTEKDLEDIRLHGKMYFLKNVKTIVPKIGNWKFHAHLSHRKSDERQYNIPGMAVTCKVKEWIADDGLWRLYHYKKGKTVKVKRHTDWKSFE